MADVSFTVAVPGVQDLERFLDVAEKLPQVLNAAKGSGKSLEELRKILVGLKGKGSALEELATAAKGFTDATAEMRKGIGDNFKSLERLLKSEFKQLTTVMQQGGAAAGAAAGSGVAAGMSEAGKEIEKATRSLSAKARKEQTKLYEAFVGNNAYTTVTKDMVDKLFNFQQAGAAISAYHQGVLRTWKASNKQATDEMLRASESEESRLQAWLQAKDSSTKRDMSIAAGYAKRSLERGKFYVGKIKAELAEEAAELKAAAKTEEDRLQAWLQSKDSETKQELSIAKGYAKRSLERGKFYVGLVKSELAEEAAELKAAAKTEEDRLQAWLKAKDADSKVEISIAAGYAKESLRRGGENVKLVKAALAKEVAEIKAAIAEARKQVSYAQSAPSGSFSRLSDRGTKIIPDSYGEEILRAGVATEKLNANAGKAKGIFKSMGDDMGYAHSAARGLASGFDLLWLTWGKILPLMAGASISFGLRKVFDIGSEVEYNIRFMREMGQMTEMQAKITREALREINANSIFTMTELSQAMTALGQAGKTAQESLTMLPAISDLATAGMVDLKTAYTLVLQAQALYGLEVKDTNKLVSQFIAITQAGTLNVEDLSASLKYASETNTRYGQSIESTLTILGELAKAGLKATSGGTAYINFLRDIAGRSGPAIKAMEALNKALVASGSEAVKLYKPEGGLRDAIDIFGDLHAAAKRLSDVDLQTIFKDLVSDRGGRAFYAMIRDGVGSLKETKTALENVNTELARMQALGLMDTTRGALKILQSNLSNTFDEVFSLYEDKFKSFFANLTVAVTSSEFKAALVSIVSGVSSLVDFITSNIGTIKSLLAVFLAFKGAMIVGSVISTITAALTTLAPVLLTSVGLLMRNAVANVTLAGSFKVAGTQAIVMAAELQAAAVGANTMQVATAGLAAKMAAASLAGRVLAVTLGFLANPVVGIIALLGTLGYAWYASSKAGQENSDDLTAKITENGKVNIDVLNKELALLREREFFLGKPTPNAAMGVYMDSAREVMRLQKDVDQATKDFGSPAPSQAKALAAAKKQSADLYDVWQSDMSERQRLKDKAASDDAARAKKAADDAKKQQDEMLKLLGKDKPGRQGSPNLTEVSAVKQNLMKETEEANRNELASIKAHYDSKQRLLKSQGENQLITQGEFVMREIALTQEAEDKQLRELAAGAARYKQAYETQADALAASFSEWVQKNPTATAEQYRKQLADTQTAMANLGRDYNTTIAKMDQDGKAIKDNAFERLTMSANKAKGELIALGKQFDDFWKKEDARAKQQERNTALEDQLRYASPEQAAYIQAVATEFERLQPEIEKTERELELLNKSWEFFIELEAASGTLSAEQQVQFDALREKIRLYREELEKLREAQGTGSGKAGSDALTKYAKEESKRLTDGLSDSIMTALFEGGKAGSKKLRDLVVNELKKPIKLVVDVVANMVMGSLGLGAAGSAAAGGAAGSAGSSMLGSFASGLSGNLLTGGVGMSGMAGFTSGLSAWGAGGSVAGVLSNPGLYSLAEIAGALGPISLGVGAILMLAKKGKTPGEQHTGGFYSSSGRTGMEAAMGITGGVEGRARDLIKRANPELESMVKTTVDSVIAATTAKAKILGMDIAVGIDAGFAANTNGKAKNKNAFGYFDVTINGETVAEYVNRELGTDLKEAATTWTTDMTNAVSEWLLGGETAAKELAITGENSTQTLDRLTNNLTAANDAFASLGYTLFDSSVAGAKLATELIDAFGSVDTFTQLAGSFYQNFYSDSEKFSTSQRLLQNAFAELNIAVPQSSQSFRALIDSAIAAGDSGLVASLMKLAPAFYEVANAVETAFDNISKTTASSVRDIQMSVLDDKGKYSFMDAEIETDLTKLSKASTPAEVENLFNQINSNITSAYGLLADTEQKRLATEFIDRLYEAEAAAQARLSITQKEVDANIAAEKAEQKEIAALERKTAEENLAAATLQRQAAERMWEAANRPILVNVNGTNSMQSQVYFS